MKVASAVCVTLAVLMAACSAAPPNSPLVDRAADAQRGALLYDTACGACHTQQVHWRDQRIVRSWSGLVVQVDRWQRTAGQSWNAQDVNDVAAYLDQRFYRLP